MLGITAEGGLDTTNTTCTGVVATPAQVANGVPSFSMGPAMFSKSKPQTDPSPNKTNTLPSRSLTFINKTSASTICLQTDSTFMHEACSGANKISKGSPYVIDSSDLQEGSNSGVGQVAAYQLTEGQQWVNTGMDSSSRVYATNLEWTMWPEQDQFTPGPTTIDISLVNGFNIGASLIPDRDTVCSIADTEGGTPYFVMYKANVPMAIFPESPITIGEVCPAENLVVDSSGETTGCYSACTYANVKGEKIDETCCLGNYHSATACTLPPTLPWTQDIDKNSTRVYSWAFEDWRGTFTCEPTAKFTFTITNPPLDEDIQSISCPLFGIVDSVRANRGHNVVPGRKAKTEESGKPYNAVILDLTIPSGMGADPAIVKLNEIYPGSKGLRMQRLFQ